VLIERTIIEASNIGYYRPGITIYRL